MNEPQSHIYEFGEFRVDAAKRLLNRNNETIPLKPKVFDTLVYLVQHHGALVDKDDLMKAVWPHTIVEENNLNQTISALRRVFGETPGENRFIATVPGRGYSFVAEVKELAATEPVAQPPAKRYRGAQRLVFILVVVLIVVGLGFVSRFLNPPARPSGPTASAVHSRSIAVLPFKPLVADLRDESLELGMTDTLIVRLSNLSEITVRPIGSVRRFGGLEQDPVIAGRELGVETVLDGQIQKSGDRIRVTARLLSVGDGQQLWAQQFDEKFTDVFTLQDILSQKIVSALELKLSSEEQRQLTKRYTENAEAYQLYITGRFHWEKRTLESLNKAIEHFQQAIEKDANYALAYAGLADTYALLGVFHLSPKEAFPKSKEAALNALRIDERLAEAHAALGHIKVQFDYDWAGAEREYKLAIGLNPNYANARHFYGIYLLAMGRFDEGLASMKRARELEPFALFIHTNVAVAYYQARRYDEAIDEAKKVLDMNPNLDLARSLLGQAYLRKGMYEEAIGEFQKRKTPGTGGVGLGQAYALSGRRSEALKEIEKLKALMKERYIAPHTVALIYASLGDKDNALEWLEKAFEDRSTMMIWIKVDPPLDGLRHEPRFREIVKRMGLEP